MTVTPLNFTFKSDPIQVIPVEGDQTALEEIRDWLISELGSAGDVQLFTTMNRRITFTSTVNGVQSPRTAYVSQCIIKDGAGQFYVLDRALLEPFYNPAP